nr:helix-turn-helix transcriptional regulator [Enhygromyxa salina]
MLDGLPLDDLLSETAAQVQPKQRRAPEVSEALQVRQPRVGQRLRQLREAAGLARVDLTEAVGVNPSALVRMEAGCNVRVSTYFPVIEHFIEDDPEAWMIADRIVLLEPHDRSKLLAALEAVELERNPTG